VQGDDELEKAFDNATKHWNVFRSAPALCVVVSAVLWSSDYIGPLESDAFGQWALLGALTIAATGAIVARPFVLQIAFANNRRRGGPLGDALLSTEIVGLALAESIAIYGAVLFLATGRFEFGLPFMVIGAAFLTRSRPNMERWRQITLEDIR
jgi:hypothetical protein